MDDINKHAIIFATRFEARDFKPPPDVILFYSGMGKKKVKNCLEKLLKKCRPHCIVNSGFAGGLNPDLSEGAIVYRTTEGDDSFFRSSGAFAARFFCSNEVVTSVEEKRALFLKTGADVVDMESDVIFNVCCENKIPCYIIRVVSDGANTAMPVDFNNIFHILCGVVKILTVSEYRNEAKEFRRKMYVSAKILGEYLDCFFAHHAHNRK
ncbi:MAG: hypothetical protein N2487_03855 [Verrucomicrobiae bacterium]|nr:hypothetical protein [Verrucomicrobiae bacterium]